MKKMLTRMWQSATALLMVLCLVVGLCPTVAFAQETEGKTIKYVSLGDSMSNGYGLTNYDNNGHNTYGEEAYPNSFAAWLKQEGYADEVTHSQLAVSAMRAEDLHFILEYDYENNQAGAYAGDQYTTNNFTEGRFDKANEFQNVAAAAKEYQDAVKAANIISVGTGNANFGVFLMYSVMDALGALGDTEDEYAWVKFEDALAECNEETKVFALQAYESIKSKLFEKVPVEANDMATKVADRMAYVVTSYVLNYGGVLEAIVELNPKAEIIIVGLMNSMNGVVFDCTIDGENFELPVGDVMNSMISAMNAYLAALPATLQAGGKYPEAAFYFASSPNVEMIVNVLSKEKMQNEDSVVRERTISEIESLVWPLLNKMTVQDESTTEDDNPYVSITPNDVKEYEGAINALLTNSEYSWFLSGERNPKKLQSVATYVAFENAAIEAAGNEDSLNGAALLKLMDMDALAESFGSIYDQFEKNIEDQSFGNNEVYMAKATIQNQVNQGLYTLLALPDAMSAALLADDDMADLLHLFARMLVGNGVGTHPSENGHKSLAKAVQESYESKHTVQDESVKNVEIVLNELYNLLETYGPEVAAQVWAQWEEYGYVEAVEKTLSELKSMLSQRYTYYTETALPAITKSVEDLSAQKDALTAELAKLKIELEAKKAELAEVINNVEIGSIHTPDINIDVELGGNEQTRVPENDCVVDGEGIEAELEAAVRDLEHAIAVIEALIADIEADIADMVALAEQIAAAVGELEKTMSDVAAAAKDLEKAVNKVINVIKNSDGVVNQVIHSFEAARATAQAAVEVLNLTIDTAEEMMADVDVMIEMIAADAEALYNKFMAELPGCIEQIPEEARMLMGGTIMAAKQAYEANKDEIYANLEAELEKLAEEYGISEESIRNKLTELAEEYGISEESIRNKLDEIEARITEEVNAKYAEIEAEIRAQIENKKAEAAEKLAVLEEELKGYQAELEGLAADAAEEVRKQLQTQIDRVTGDIATVNEDLACAIEHLENAAQEAYEKIVAEVTEMYEDAVAKLEKQLAELKAAYDKAVAELKKQLEELKAAYDKAVEELIAAADKAIAELTEALNKLLEELGKIGEALADEVNGILTAIREELAAAQKAVEEILKGNLAAIEELKNALLEMGGEAIVDAVESLIDAVMALIEEATTADLVIDDDFKYVAIGDGSAETESYVEKLAAALNAEAAENGVNEIELANYAKAGNTVAAERANLSDVTGADLITIGFSNVEFIAKAVNTALNGGEMDWAAVVGAENVQYVDELLAEVAAKIAETGIEGESAELVNSAIEAYAYAAMVYATELPGLINDIRAVNPDALVIIVGMYNPMDGVIIDLGGNATLDMGEYIDYLVKGAGVHGVAYSILSGNSIYVDAPSVSTINTDKELGLRKLYAMINSGFAELYPSAVGDDYIAAEIADALNITYVKTEVRSLPGDVDMDGDVDGMDLLRLQKYLAGDSVEIDLKAADVYVDEIVDGLDLLRLQKHLAGDNVTLG